MIDISVVICTHDPRPDYLHRVLRALNEQTLPPHKWELLIVDNASHERLAYTYDLSWHAHAKHVHEDKLGLTPARFRGIAEARGELLVFVDDDNVLDPSFLEEAWAIHVRYPHVSVFGAGRLEPEFEVQPPQEIRSRLGLLALRSVTSARWSNNAKDFQTIPWGAGLCVSREVAKLYQQFVERLNITAVLGRRGSALFAGDDDVFSWIAGSVGSGFGIFPQLRVTHLIATCRLRRPYVLKLLHDHTFSHSVLNYLCEAIEPRRIDWVRYVRLVLHGMMNGPFSMRCHWAAASGEDKAARFAVAERLQPVEWLGDAEMTRARSRLRLTYPRLGEGSR